jgi:O-antigen ligase
MVLVEKIYGITGRNTGTVTYLCLIILLTSAIFAGGRDLNLSLLKGLTISGLISSIYGLIQFMGYDPFDWTNEYSSVIGFFGNPNFQSSFIAITILAAIGFLIYIEKKLIRFLILFVQIPISIFVLLKTESLQGILLLVVGFSVLYGCALYRNVSKKSIFYLYCLVVFITLIGGILDMLRKTPWTPLIYKNSISERGDLWRAGLKMIHDQPLFGFGMDGFKDNFKIYRDESAFVSGRTIIGDSPHNLFIEFGVGGGIPLVLIYGIINLMVLRSFIRVIRRSTEQNFTFYAVFSCWVMYLAQALISVSQIGLSIWGWLLSGAIIGFDLNSISKGTNQTKNIKMKKNYFTVFILMFGFILSILPVYSDYEFRAAVASGSIPRIEKSIKLWPQSSERILVGVELLANNGFQDYALKFARLAVEANPNNFQAWQQLNLLPNSTKSEKQMARMKLKSLDPKNSSIYTP